MTTGLTASVTPIIVDKQAGETSGSSTIKYLKERPDELWNRTNGGPWSEINVHVITGQGDEAETGGEYQVTLKPGEIYEVGAFEQGHGPGPTTDPIRLATLIVFCLWKRPEGQPLITDWNQSTGGTWHTHHIHTRIPTSVVLIGASRVAPTIDADGLPHLVSPDGGPTAPTTVSNDHVVELKPLVPGHHYFFAAVVTDEFGNWHVCLDEFTTMRRKVTVEFPTLHVFNDGDGGTYGEAEFWFRVFRGPANQPKLIQEFHRSEQDVDDWSETDRPYPLGYAHVGLLEVVPPEARNVAVDSRGIEHDGVFDTDEGAWGFGVDLNLPAGRFVETVTGSTFQLDCPTSTVGDDFHYGVDVRWSVEYAP